MNTVLAHALAAILDWFAPRACLGCGSELDGDGEWCRSCVELLESNPVRGLGELALLAPFRHTGPIRDAVHRLKYAGRSDLAPRLVAAGFAARPDMVGSDAILVPVPLHPCRLVERGYNQSALLARALACRWRLPCALHLLRRQIATVPQVGQSREQRASNMRGAFEARSSACASKLWLVDDVVTTGATTFSCREALEDVGVRVEGVIALAHATSGGADVGS